MAEVLAYNSEAEQSILGALMCDYGAYAVIQPLKDTHFYSFVHAEIYRAITEIVNTGTKPDPLLIANKLGDNLEACGGTEYLEALYHCVPSASNVARYAQIVREKATQRKMLEAIDQARSIVMQNIPNENKISACIQSFLSIEQCNVKKMPEPLYDVMLGCTAHYEAVQKGEIEPGWRTGIQRLDEVHGGGLRPGEVTVLAARPSVGKSSLSLQIGLDIAKGGKPALFLSMEMPKQQVGGRAMSHLGRIDSLKMKRGEMSTDDWARAVDALEQSRGLKVMIDDQPSLTLADVFTKARSIPKLKLLVVDYLQLSTGDGDSTNERIQEFSQGLKRLAKELDAHVIALSQLNRKVEERANKKPCLADLRDSGAIEQDADNVWLLWPVKDYGDGRHLIGLIVAKNREGEKCEIPLHFDGKTQHWGQSTESLEVMAPVKQYRGGGLG